MAKTLIRIIGTTDGKPWLDAYVNGELNLENPVVVDTVDGTVGRMFEMPRISIEGFLSRNQPGGGKVDPPCDVQLNVKSCGVFVAKPAGEEDNGQSAADRDQQVP